MSHSSHLSHASHFAFDWLSEHAGRTPDAPCVGTPSGWVTYGELAARTRALAAELAASGGVVRGEKVLVAVPNTPAAVAASLAVQWLGAVAVEVNREWGAESLAGIAAQTRARVAVVLGRDAALWGKVPSVERFYVVHPSAPPPRMLQALGKRPARWLDEDGRGEHPADASVPAVRDEKECALLVYTSGSTGTPRGVIQTHRNISANTRSIVEYLELTAADRVMSILPLYYCYGKSLLQTHLFAGGSVFFDHRFLYPRVVMEAIGTERCTGFSGVPLTFELLRRQVDIGSVALGSLRYLTQAGGAMRPDTIQWVRNTFRPARLFVMYGQTEATARLSYLPPERAEEKAGSIGRGIPRVELRVMNEEGVELPPGEVGHLVARGENVTPGYFEAAEETAAILRGEWLWTGDLAYRDPEGFIFITGRAKEMLKLGGHRVSPAEIEHVLCEHPEVADAAVVGAPDELGGEQAVAFVVARAGAQPAEAELRKHCRAHLPAFKVPRAVVLADELPRTSAGKVARAELRAKAAGLALAAASPGDAPEQR